MAAFQSCAFSESIEQSNGLVQFSPHTAYIGIACGNRLIIRNASSLDIVQIYPCIDRVERLEWSPDGQYIYVVMVVRAAVQVFSVADPKWTW